MSDNNKTFDSLLAQRGLYIEIDANELVKFKNALLEVPPIPGS
uniref:Uncharacterized protein n=1 Tax=Parascaris equorum TaxID=6256 RepID=A0A914RYS0_PAREQ